MRFLVIVYLLIVFKSFGQIDDFRDVLTKPEVGKVIRNKQGDIDSERTYLGAITIKGKLIYYVVKEFYTVQAAVVKHGHSRVIFFNSKKKRIEEYHLDLPLEHLPIGLKDNKLLFKNNKVEIGAKLPSHLCPEPEDCYPRSNL